MAFSKIFNDAFLFLIKTDWLIGSKFQYDSRYFKFLKDSLNAGKINFN